MGESRNEGQLLRDALALLQRAEARIKALEGERREPIAVIGMACRFPGGVHDPESFYDFLREGRDGIGRVPADRWDADALYGAEPGEPGKIHTRYGGFVDGAERFDAAFFDISPREAESLDPQQRMLLEVSWEALERAGLAPLDHFDSRTGVFIGISGSDYLRHISQDDPSRIDAYMGTGNAHSSASGRLSYFFGFQGPCVSIDTACSSSLVALHAACQSLRAGESEMALAGGVNHLLMPDMSINFSRAHMLAPDGRCKSFDASANGYVRAEGCGIVVLKRLSSAVAAGDPILAVIRGSAVNQDGRSSGLTVPNGPAQQAVIRDALKNAGVEPSQVSYIEAHGTGTALGDPIEADALGAVFGARDRSDPLWVGSVKSNIGHLESAAGIASLIKTILCLQHGELTRTLHFTTPSPHIAWDAMPLRVVASQTAWSPNQGRRIAGVSSFSFSGTNAHVVVEEYVGAPPHRGGDAPARPWQGLALSARSETALRQLAGAYARRLASTTDDAWPGICAGAALARSPFEYRRVFVGSTATSLRAALDECAAGTTPVATASARKIGFLFTGQGSQYPNMARGLYEAEPVFRDTVRRLCDLLEREFGVSLLPVLYPEVAPAPGATSALDDTAFTQPALFIVEYALAELWKSWGVEPDAVAGHSVGEYVAAAVAGVFSAEDGLRLIAERARLLSQLPAGGGMVSVFARRAIVESAIAQHARTVSIAAINGDEHVVIAGAMEALALIETELRAAGVRTRQLVVSHAFHSPLTDPILDRFRRAAGLVSFNEPYLTFVSALTGAVESASVCDPEYWVRHVRQPVLFHQALGALDAAGCNTLVEVGPQAVLSSLAEASPRQGRVCLPSLRRQRDDSRQILESIGALFEQGVPVNWRAYFAGRASQRTGLPTYPFERKRHWFAPSVSRTTSDAAAVERRFAIDGVVGGHQVFGEAIVPAAAFLEMALAAGSRDGRAVQDFRIHRALPVGANSAKQVVLTKVDGDGYELRGRDAGSDGDGSVCASLRLVAQTPAPMDALKIEAVVDSFATEIPVRDFYAQLRRKGFDYGESFRLIDRLRVREGAALASIRRATSASTTDTPTLDTCTLDACFQTLLAVLPSTDGRAVWLPVSVGRLSTFRAPTATLWCLAEVTSTGDAELTANLRVVDHDGQTVALVEGMTARQASMREVAQEGVGLDDVLYRPEWVRTSLFEGPAPALPGVGDLAPGLRAELDEGRRTLAIDRCATGVAELNALTAGYIVSALRALGMRFETGERLTASLAVARHRRLAERLFAILAAEGVLAKDGDGWIVTRPPESADMRQASAAVRERYPEISAEVTLTDRCGSALADVLRGSVEPITELLFPSNEPITAASLFRDARASQVLNRLIVSILHQAMRALPTRRGLRILEVGAGMDGTVTAVVPHLDPARTTYHLADVSGGMFSDIAAAATRRIREQLAAYSFVSFHTLDLDRDPASQGFAPVSYDVVIAPNILHATQDVGRSAGQLRRLLAPGGLLVMIEGTQAEPWVDLVYGMTPPWWAFTDHAVRPDHPLAAPDRWASVLCGVGFDAVESFVCAPLSQALIAASASAADTSAARERVLLLSDGAGLGDALAAALRERGCTVTMVARAEDCRHVLAGSGDVDQCVMLWPVDAVGVEDVPASARQLCASALEVVQALASRAGQPAPRLTCVTRGALSIGGERADGLAGSTVWGFAKSVAAEYPELRVRCIDLAGATSSDDVSILVDELRSSDEEQVAYRSGERFAARLVHDAAAPDGQVVCAADATYIVTGGAGELGLHAAGWLIDRGARHVTLVSRRPPGQPAEARIHEWRAAGIEIAVRTLDVADRQAVQALVGEYGRTLPRLAGLIHAAGVFDDGTIADVTVERLAHVLAPKVDGAWHLHTCTRALALDFFVMYSSAASVFGSAGQASYVSANAFLDALGHARRAEGLPATTINWGGWRKIGFAARSGAERLLRSRGIGSVTPAFAGMALERAIASGRGQLAIVPMDWPQFFAARTSTWSAFEAFAGPSVPTSGTMPAVFAGLNGKSRADASVWMRQYVATQVASVLRLGSADEVPATRNFFQMGMDSLTSIELRNRLRDDLGQPLPATLAFDCPTVPALADYLAALLPDSGSESATTVTSAASQQPLQPDDDAVAIIGMACRFPGGADTPDVFLDQLRAGRDAISEVPRDRWDADAWFDPNPDMPGKINTRFGGFVPGCENFDPAFFEITPREARSVDPQHRMLLEVSWEALENAGLVPSALAGSQTGVFVGITGNDYYRMITETAGAQRIDAYLGTGNAHSAASGRLSYFFGFKGPCMSIDTACSSALVALHTACQSLRSGESEMALAGGVNHLLLPEMSVNFAKAHMLAPDGRCKAFDSRADGYVRSEGCGMVVLKRLSRALADGDPVLAVIRGSAVNQDGQSGGLTVPNGPSQSEVIRRALAQARVEPGDVSYVEAHGTGTSLGDPIEVNALHAVFGARDAAEPLWIGSVKSNVGHLESAAGVASVIKTVLCLQAGELVPSLHCDTPNPHLDWQAMPIKVATQRSPWKATRRIAGVSSFSFSGTNAHVVIEQAPAAAAHVPSSAGLTPGLAVSARSDEALRDQARRYAEVLRNHPEDVHAICAAAAVHREAFDHRLFVAGPDAEAMSRSLRAFADGQPSEGILSGRAHRGAKIPAGSTDVREIGRAFVEGAQVEWSSLYGSNVPHYRGLPNYPFQRQRHWYNAIDVCYRRVWEARTLDNAAANRHGGLWVVCADQPWPALTRALEQAGCRVAYATHDTYLDHARGAERLQGVLHLWQPSPDGVDVAAALDRLATLARTLAARPDAPALWVATRQSTSAGDAPVTAPFAPALAAMGRCLFLEYTAIKGGLVDVAGSEDADAVLLAAELLARAGEDCVTLSGGHRFVSRLESYRPVDANPVPVSRDGAYLISGGLGALGLEFAGDLADRGAGAVILMGRSAPSETAAHAIARLESKGTRVLTVSGDVTDASTVRAAMALAPANGFTLRGVVHAAGINERRAVADMTVDDIQAVLSPKATGAWVLHQATQDQRLEFFLLCSSITSVWGSTQQAHYAAANAVLDGLAEYRRARGLPALSINWGPWAGAGMSMPDGGRRVIDGGLRLLEPADALSVLGPLLRSPESCMVVADVDWPRVKDLYQVHGRQPLFERVGAEDAPAPGAASSLVRELEALSGAERFERLARPVEAAIGNVLGLAGGQSLEREVGFFDLGVDSLMSVQIKDRIQQLLGREFPASLCFDYPTVTTLVTHLLDELFTPAPVAAAPIRAGAAKARVDERAIQQLSDEQVAALIAEEMKALNLE